MSNILGINTATEVCSVALLYDNGVDQEAKPCERDHARLILPMVENMLERHSLCLSQLDALAFARGPGSFTGVRIGVSVAQGLALGAVLPLVAISTLMTLAESVWQQYGSTRVLVAMDARMGELYWAEYRRDNKGRWQGEETESVMKAEAIMVRMNQLDGEWTLSGNGWQVYPELRTQVGLTLHETNIFFPYADVMLPLAKILLTQGNTLLPEQAEPTYLRSEISWKKLPGRL